MIRREDLPEDAANWTIVQVSFDRLYPDSEKGCPATRGEIMDYIRTESADTDSANTASLRFVRTAHVGESSYWLWSYTESDGTVCFVAFSQSTDGSTVLGMSEANGLSPEQYLLADYYDEAYWS